jgi:hypothetical protein
MCFSNKNFFSLPLSPFSLSLLNIPQVNDHNLKRKLTIPPLSHQHLVNNLSSSLVFVGEVLEPSGYNLLSPGFHLIALDELKFIQCLPLSWFLSFSAPREIAHHWARYNAYPKWDNKSPRVT